VLVVLLIGGGIAIAVNVSSNKPKPPVAFPTPEVTHLSPPPAPTLGDTPTGAASTGSGGPSYQTDTDLCGKLKYPSLGDWAITKSSSYPPRKHGTGMADSYQVDCRDEFKNGKTGRFSSVDVHAQIFASVGDAQDGYKIAKDVDRSRYDKDLTGYGDDAYGTYRTWTPGFNTSDYSVVMRSGNLVLQVHVSVSMENFIPKDTMLTRVSPTTQGILALIPKASHPGVYPAFIRGYPGAVGAKVAEVALKASAGGLFVLAFAALAQMLAPKRFAGVFSAAPSVALGSLLVTAAFSGVHDVGRSARGMQIGAVAFTVYCLAAVPLLRRFGAWRGSLAALLVWGLVAGVGYAVLA